MFAKLIVANFARGSLSDQPTFTPIPAARLCGGNMKSMATLPKTAPDKQPVQYPDTIRERAISMCIPSQLPGKWMSKLWAFAFIIPPIDRIAVKASRVIVFLTMLTPRSLGTLCRRHEPVHPLPLRPYLYEHRVLSRNFATHRNSYKVGVLLWKHARHSWLS